MICSQCRTENDSARKFCMECGARLVSGCPNCGAQNPDAAKFCGECGTTLQPERLASPTGAPSPTLSASATGTAERRLVTVLFADLVGFTGMAADQDPEDTREFLTRYFDATRTIVGRYGGTIEKFIGDAVMAVWGAPTAHEDDAERAVRAALDIIGSVPALDEKLVVQVRAGVLTGEAAVTLGATGQGMVAGDLVNTASRLQSVAPPGSVLVGESTYHATSGAIRFEQVGDQLLKGKQAPVPAWRATAVVALLGGSGRSEALEPPFIGRDEELRLVKEQFHATEREHKARLVLIVGQAGIGKSRLAWEFEKYVDGVVGQVWWHAGRSPAYGEGISYWALAEMVRGRAGIAETDDASVARGRLREAVTEWVPDETERRWIEPRLAALLALEPMPPGSRDELFAAWRTFLERIAERGPAVLVFEDVQWADDGLIDFIEDLLDRSRNHPIFVVALARPEFSERRAGWGSQMRSFTAMGLEPLSDDQIAGMIRGTVPGIPDGVVAAIVGRAEGVPLYAVETVRMLIDRGELRATADGRYELTGRIDRLAVPETLHALIAARLDALDEQERKVLQTAAVLGQSFTAEALSAVGGESAALADRLAGLVRRQLMRVDVDPRSPERGQYQFVQVVVKEVAEGSLARADRRALHLAAARHYESLGDEELAGVLASHYLDAYRATPAGPEADAIAAQARVSLRAAADRAAALHSQVQALSYLEQAIAVTIDPAELAAIHERAASAAAEASRQDDGRAHAREAEALHGTLGDRLGVLRAITAQAHAFVSEHNERPAIALLRPALDAVADLGQGPDVTRAQDVLARALMLGSEYREAIERCNQVLAAPAYATDEELVQVMITKGSALLAIGGEREAEVLLRGAIIVAGRLGLAEAEHRARNNAFGVLSRVDKSEAENVFQQGYELALRLGFKTRATHSALVSLNIAFLRGDWEAWLDETARLEPTGFYRGVRELELARRAAFRGRREEAEAHARDAIELVGGSSSQGAAEIGEFWAGFHVAAGDWDRVMAAAREGWSHQEWTLNSIGWAIMAGIAAGERSWIAEAVEILDSPSWLGQENDGARAAASAGTALIDGRWNDARSYYLAARRALEDADERLKMALLDLAVGFHAAGRFPEAADAASAAEEFFASVGAQSFVQTYRARAVPHASGTTIAAPRTESQAAAPSTAPQGQ